MTCQVGTDAGYLLARKPEILAQFGRTVRAMQVEHRFKTWPDHVHVRRPMIVRINRHT
jgi:hypothetical protein